VSPEIEHFERSDYGSMLVHMRAVHAAVHAGDSPGRILMVEHAPVWTAGRATPPEDRAPELVAIERGGQITYHGPGQLVVYPIVRLPRRDLRDWLRRLERFGIAVAAAFDLAAEAAVDGTGVFVDGKKFASIGVHVKHWINLHGIGINVAMDLAPWHRFRPCGKAPELMTDLSRAAQRPLTLAAARAAATAAVSVLTDPGHPL
jgi:lipoyl(octanoyl) transferase